MRERHNPIFNNNTKRIAYVFTDDNKTWNVTLGYMGNRIKRPTISGLKREQAVAKGNRWCEGEMQSSVVFN